MSKTRLVSKADWLSEGAKLFGESVFSWKFVCPACGNVASVEDFRAYKAHGASPDSAYFNCIGRFYPTEARGGWSSFHSNPKISRPCDYTAGGLFQLCRTKVVDINDTVIPVFEFYRKESE